VPDNLSGEFTARLKMKTTRTTITYPDTKFTIK
jgi:hypothetical protein